MHLSNLPAECLHMIGDHLPIHSKRLFNLTSKDTYMHMPIYKDIHISLLDSIVMHGDLVLLKKCMLMDCARLATAAAVAGRINILRYLINKKKVPRDYTWLPLASENNHYGMVQFLYSMGYPWIDHDRFIAILRSLGCPWQ